MRFVKILKYSTAALAVAALIGACSGDKKDPKTVTPDDLNPPHGLTTLTGSGKVTLRWSVANTEEGFQGYDVFAVKKSLAQVKEIVKASALYPNKPKVTDLGEGSIPRCQANSALFVAFGLPATDKDCEGAAAEEEEDNEASGLMAAGDEAAEILTGIVKCAEGSSVDGVAAEGNDNISLPATKALGEAECVVERLGDADRTPLKDGDTYTFFVTAIMGGEFNNMSWTSSFVEDTPRPVLFSGEVKIAVGKALVLPADKIIGLDKFVAADIETVNCQNQFCRINSTNEADAGIYIGRLGETAGQAAPNYPQRVFISAAKDEGISLELRGPQQTKDPAKPGEISDVIPGDQAVDSTYGSGNLITVTGNQVIDMKFTASGKTHFGKIVIHALERADAADEKDDITFKITVMAQPAENVRHYWR